jgi:TfoX/Sxy family transcriptional regulator of competence genes
LDLGRACGGFLEEVGQVDVKRLLGGYGPTVNECEISYSVSMLTVLGFVNVLVAPFVARIVF